VLLGGLYAIDKLGMLLSLKIIGTAPAVVLMMSSSRYTLTSASHRVPFLAFIGIALARQLVADPVNYYLIGRRNANLAQSWQEMRNPIARWILRRLATASHRTMLVAVFALTLFPPPLVPIVSVYALAGAAKVNPVAVAVVDIAATLVYLMLYYWIGSFINPSELAQQVLRGVV
jgi:hypothetical protein